MKAWFDLGEVLYMEYNPAPPISGGKPKKTGFLVRWMMKVLRIASDGSNAQL